MDAVVLSLGGWVATRASGMKKNVYGNIEDILVGFRMVTPSGTLQKCSDIPRVSCGPDFTHVVLGSEGCALFLKFSLIFKIILHRM